MKFNEKKICSTQLKIVQIIFLKFVFRLIWHIPIFLLYLWTIYQFYNRYSDSEYSTKNKLISSALLLFSDVILLLYPQFFYCLGNSFYYRIYYEERLSLFQIYHEKYKLFTLLIFRFLSSLLFLITVSYVNQIGVWTRKFYILYNMLLEISFIDWPHFNITGLSTCLIASFVDLFMFVLHRVCIYFKLRII